MRNIYTSAAFFAFHLLVFAAAFAYVFHLFGIDVPLLDHHHGCISPKG